MDLALAHEHSNQPARQRRMEVTHLSIPARPRNTRYTPRTLTQASKHSTAAQTQLTD